MSDNFYLSLAAILFLPIIPAYILYKFLPASDTDVSGPYQGLSLKLKGAFAGYFLLVIVGLALQYAVMNNKQQKTIEALTRNVEQRDTVIKKLQADLLASANPVVDWHITGIVTPGGSEGTRFFYDDGTTESNPDGSFDLVKRVIARESTAKPPRWMCVYNLNTGFKIISLNRDIPHPDIAAYHISFDDAQHQIRIQKPIDINSLAKDSIVAVANFIENNPDLKAKVQQIDPAFLSKAATIRQEQQLDKSRQIQFNKALLKRTPTPLKP